METVIVEDLEWQKKVPEDRFTYKEAQDYASSLGDGWRIPTKDEIVKITKRAHNPSIDPVLFPDTPPGVFWTCVPYDRLPHYMVTMSFYGGHLASHEVNTKNRIRLVRRAR